jgi:hypothetical protein
MSDGPAEGHPCLANLAQGTLCKILDSEDVKPHKVRYYLEKRDPEFAKKMAEVLCVYLKVKLLKKAVARSKQKPSDRVAIVQAIATTSPISRPSPVFIRPSPATMNTSATARSACWPHNMIQTSKSLN